jgi:hypothetical protein
MSDSDKNTIKVTHNGDVWRATLGDEETGHTSASTSPWLAIQLTCSKAQEAGHEFDGASVPIRAAKRAPSAPTEGA